jgi:hypothetical protein
MFTCIVIVGHYQQPCGKTYNEEKIPHSEEEEGYMTTPTQSHMLIANFFCIFYKKRIVIVGHYQQPCGKTYNAKIEEKIPHSEEEEGYITTPTHSHTLIANFFCIFSKIRNHPSYYHRVFLTELLS